MRRVFTFMALLFLVSLIGCSTTAPAQGIPDTLEENPSTEKPETQKTEDVLQSLFQEPVQFQPLSFVIKTLTNKITDFGNSEDPLHVDHFYLKNPDSAGGVGAVLKYENQTDKTIKYLRLKITPYNAVDDKQYCEIQDRSTMTLKVTGPVAPGESDYAEWRAIWYNYSIRKFTLDSIEIEYMDGSIVQIPEKDEPILVTVENWRQI